MPSTLYLFLWLQLVWAIIFLVTKKDKCYLISIKPLSLVSQFWNLLNQVKSFPFFKCTSFLASCSWVSLCQCFTIFLNWIWACSCTVTLTFVSKTTEIPKPFQWLQWKKCGMIICTKIERNKALDRERLRELLIHFAIKRAVPDRSLEVHLYFSMSRPTWRD